MKRYFTAVMALLVIAMVIPINSIFAETTFSSSEIYYIKNLYSGKYLEISSNVQNSVIYQTDFTASKKQQFILKPTKSGGVAILSAENDALRFDVSGADIKNGTLVKLNSQNNDYIKAQHFLIKDNGDGTIRFVSELSDTEKVLEIGGPTKKSGAGVQIWNYVGAKNQKWLLISQKNAEAEDSKIPHMVNLYVSGTYYNMEITDMYLYIDNTYTQPIITTDEFRLDFLRDNEWEEYASRQYTKFDKTQFSIPAQSSYSFIGNLMNASAKPLLEGYYRIAKKFTVKDSSLPEFERYVYFSAYNGMYNFTNTGSDKEVNTSATLRKSYFKASTEFDTLWYMNSDDKNGTSTSISTSNRNDIEDVLETVLQVTGEDITSSLWYAKVSALNPYYSLVFENDDDEITVGLCGIKDNVGYISMLRDGKLVMRLAVKPSKYNTIEELIKTALKIS